MLFSVLLPAHFAWIVHGLSARPHLAQVHITTRVSELLLVSFADVPLEEDWSAEDMRQVQAAAEVPDLMAQMNHIKAPIVYHDNSLSNALMTDN